MDSHSRPPKLMDRVKATMRVKHYSPRTEKTYCYWIRFFIRFHGICHPSGMGGAEVRAFLEHLAVEHRVAAATQNQALNALVFLYRHVLDQPLGDIGEFSRAKRPRRFPVVLSHEDVIRALSHLAGPMHLMATLMYGSGLRLIETCRLRVRDIDFARQIVTVRAGKGDKDRTTLLPGISIPALQQSITVAKHQLEDSMQHGSVPVTLPHALDRKYSNAGVSLAWQWLFPASRPCFDDAGKVVLHHIHPGMPTPFSHPYDSHWGCDMLFWLPAGVSIGKAYVSLCGIKSSVWSQTLRLLPARYGSRCDRLGRSKAGAAVC